MVNRPEIITLRMDAEEKAKLNKFCEKNKVDRSTGARGLILSALGVVNARA